MKQLVAAVVIVFGSVLASRTGVLAQAPANSQASQPPASPAWAYGLPPADAPPPPPPARSPNGSGPRQPDTTLHRIPGSAQAFTLAHIRDYWDVGDWFPDEHPPMPTVVVHGRQPHVRGCAMCHMPSGQGRPENAPVAGQPYAYIVQQLHDFKAGLRTSADTRKTNTVQMIEAATDMTDQEIDEAATYFSSLKWTPWIRVVEADTVPKVRLGGNVFLKLPGTDTEPIGRRIVETPEDDARFELRDPHSGFIAYVPKGSVQRGARLVASGGGKTTACGTCHGVDLGGLGPVPAIAGRSPSYIVRQLWDFQQGTRKGLWSPLMKPIVEHLTQDDMLDIAAYVASQQAR